MNKQLRASILTSLFQLRDFAFDVAVEDSESDMGSQGGDDDNVASVADAVSNAVIERRHPKTPRSGTTVTSRVTAVDAMSNAVIERRNRITPRSGTTATSRVTAVDVMSNAVIKKRNRKTPLSGTTATSHVTPAVAVSDAGFLLSMTAFDMTSTAVT